MLNSKHAVQQKHVCMSKAMSLQEKVGYSDCTQQNASAFAATAVKSGKEVGMLNAG